MGNKPAKVIAKSASDKDPNWPYWLLWADGRNVTAAVALSLGYSWTEGAVLGSRQVCMELMEEYNGR